MRYFLPAILVITALLVGLAAPTAQAAFPAQAGPYVVQPGDTVNSILLRFCISWQELYALNSSVLTPNPNVLRWNTVLQVVNRCGGAAPPIGGGCPQACPQTCPQGPIPHAMGVLNGATYTVAAGDTLYSVARRFCTTVDALTRSNGIANPWRIWVGQCLTVPVNGIGPNPTPTPGGPTPTATLTPSATTTPTPTPSAATIVIDTPAANAQVGRVVLVTGHAAGIQSGWIVVQAVDSSGAAALGQSFAPVINGIWTTVLTVNAPAGSAGSIFAYWDRNTVISARVAIRYGG